MSLVLDIVLAGLVLLTALWSIRVRDRRDAVIAFIAFGLLLSLVWMRLYAVDVALTEAAIGGGATGLVLLRACARLLPAGGEAALPRPPVRVLAAGLCLLVTALLCAAVLRLPDPAPSLAAASAAPMPGIGMENPVTVVLLAYRAIDTLLEKIVLILALVGVWSLAPDPFWGGRPGSLRAARTGGALTLLAQVLPPIGVLAGLYLVWTGADRPGGTFQGGTVLAAMWLIVMMADLRQPPETRLVRLRRLVVVGPALFVATGFAGFWMADGFLSYPPGLAKPIIVAIEAALALSIAAILAMLVAGPAERAPKP